ncbi:hypothetical protein RRG58_07930 [Mycoplasmopsis cynos]|nr:hypothetical protein [Mycoplasmopsis felis]WQQ11595.1 hypothetical protein RRG50_04115 [Mycoplasmopsis felis]
MKNKIILKGFTAPFLFFSVGLVSANVSNNVSSNRFGVHNSTNDFRSYNANRNLLHSSYNLIDLNSNRKVFNTYYRNNTDLNFLFNGLTVRKELDNILKFRSNTDDAYLLSSFRLHNTNHKGLNNIRFFDLRKNRSTSAMEINYSDFNNYGISDFSNTWSNYNYFNDRNRIKFPAKEYDGRWERNFYKTLNEASSYNGTVSEYTYSNEKRFKIFQADKFIKLLSDDYKLTLNEFAKLNGMVIKEVNGDDWSITNTTHRIGPSGYGSFHHTRDINYSSRPLGDKLLYNTTRKEIIIKKVDNLGKYWFNDIKGLFYWSGNLVYKNSLLSFSSKMDDYLRKGFPLNFNVNSRSYNIDKLRIIDQKKVAHNSNSNSNVPEKIFSYDFDIREKSNGKITFNNFYGLKGDEFEFLIYSLININENNALHDIKAFKNLIHNNKILIYSDSGKTSLLTDKINKSVYVGSKTNIEKLEEEINKNKFEIVYKNLTLKFRYDYQISSYGRNYVNLKLILDDILYSGSSIKNSLNNNLRYDLRKSFNFFNDTNVNGRYLYFVLNHIKDWIDNSKTIRSNIKIDLEDSDLYKRISHNLALQDRIIFNYSYVLKDNVRLNNFIDNQNNWNRDTYLELDRRVQILPPDANANYGGKWKVKAPIEVKFLANLSESEVLLINKNRVDVLNRWFKYDLRDNRSSINDESRELYDKNSKEEANETNSHKKNEYSIELIKYRENTNNTQEEYKYKIDFIIDSYDIEQSIKYYAWNPEINKDQNDLITPYLMENGEFIKDKNGNKIPNPKYDASIDKQTGTKKQLVWIDTNLFKSNSELLRKISFAFPKLDRKYNFGIFAEASVLGKGALRNVFGNFVGNANSEYYSYQLFNKINKGIYENKGERIVSLNAELGSSESSYMSSEGIYLVWAKTANSISDIQLILIDEDNKSDSFFLDEIEKINFNSIPGSSNNLEYLNIDGSIKLNEYISNFWKISNPVANAFSYYLINNRNLKEEEIKNLSFVNVKKYYLDFINNNLFGSLTSESINSNNIFGGYEFNNLNLNGLVLEQKEIIIKKVKEFIQKELNKFSYLHKINDLVYENDYYIEEFQNERDTQNFINKVGVVQKKSENLDVNYFDINVVGLKKYNNSNAVFRISNVAWNSIYPPVDLSNLNINFINKIRVDKKELREEYGELLNSYTNFSDRETYLDNLYETKINQAIEKVINDFLVEYNKGKEFNLELGKDILITNKDEVISRLKNSPNKDIYLRLIGDNANLLNYKEIIFNNSGKNDVVNLSDFTKILTGSNKVLNTSNLENIRYETLQWITNKGKEINLEINDNYLVYGANTFLYWLDLIIDINDETLSDRWKEKISQFKEFLSKNNTLRNGEFIKFIPEKENEIHLLNNQKEALLNMIVNDKIGLYKQFIILPKENKSFNYAYGGIINAINENELEEIKLNDDKIKEIEDLIKDDDVKTEDEINIIDSKEETKKKVIKVISIVSGIVGVIGSLIGIIFIAKSLSIKYGFKLGINSFKKNKKKAKTKIK